MTSDNTAAPSGAAPRVIGLDASLTGTGIASSIGWCTIVGRAGVTNLPLADRDRAIVNLARGVLDTVGTPDLAVIEAPAYSRSGGGAHERSGLWWRVVRHLLAQGVPVAEVAPTQRCRYATGKGQALKTAVVDAVARRWPQYVTGGNDNLADAVVLCAMGADHLGYPIATVPATHRAALDRITWPEFSESPPESPPESLPTTSRRSG
ncbi:crossover junction endodeoxyribonuclease RuvC [Haloactinospora alba]|uniref:Crossover junction endodeoxyribonuclease RuvC n=1 Tax=Haloactinospora alba TaxID=405555 RepID=A0A543NFH2_9ACTN|nr:hypothetical protein [Haloactinospora alba]TQN30584.1 crossover junction endodeoxyribonuclease RuvC [Haloactinospora alba]